MKRCETCRFWFHISTEYDDKWGYCEKCDGSRGLAADPQSLAYAVDVESFQASLRTHAEFSCCQYDEL